MRVSELMSQPVVTVSGTESAEAAWTVMRTRGIHHLVVLSDRQIAGLVSDRDLGGRRGASARANRTAGDLMTAPVVTVDPTITVRRAANLMRGRSIGCLVVAAKGRAVGIVTTADLLELLGRGAERPVVQGKRWTLKHRAPHRARHAACGVW